jgi:hypothetical protein
LCKDEDKRPIFAGGNMNLVCFMEKGGLGKIFEYHFCMEGSKKNEGKI